MRVVKGRGLTRQRVTEALTTSGTYMGGIGIREVSTSRLPNSSSAATAESMPTAYSIQLQNMSKGRLDVESVSKMSQPGY